MLTMTGRTQLLQVIAWLIGIDMEKEIELSQGYRAIVDEADYEDLMHFNWFASVCRNIRLCTAQQNSWNRRKRIQTNSKYKGVNKSASKLNPWYAQICDNGKIKHLGCYETRKEAAIAYNGAAIALYGDFAHLNDIYGEREIHKTLSDDSSLQN